MRTSYPIHCNGQAAVEFLLGLLAIVLLLAGLIQYALLAGLQTDFMAEVREEAGEQALSGSATTSEGSALLGILASQSAQTPEQWLRADAGRAVKFDGMRLNESAGAYASTLAGTAPVFGFIHSRRAQTFDIEPILRTLAGIQDSVTIEAEVWMPPLGDLY
jgi:hypothetical protein